MKQSFGRKENQCELREELRPFLSLTLSATIWTSVCLFLLLFLSVSYSDGIASRVSIGKDVFRQII